MDPKSEPQTVARVALKERARQVAGALSGGEQQMAAIGRGLMAQPRLLMLDEPTLGLCAARRRRDVPAP